MINQIIKFVKEHTIGNSGKNFEWIILNKVKFTQKFEVYGFIVSLDRCICENKEVGININNQYNIKKAIKYRFNIDCIMNIILVKKISDDEYVVFKKQEIS